MNCLAAQLVRSLGLMVFQALDFGLSSSEEQRLSAPLEQLIEGMTAVGGRRGAGGRRGSRPEREGEGDEGIEDDGGDHEEESGGGGGAHLTLAQVVEVRRSLFLLTLFIRLF